MKGKKMVKAIAACLLTVVSLSATACGYFQHIGVPEVKWVELSDVERAISYNGAIYRENSDITEGTWFRGDYFLNYSQGYNTPLAYNQIFGRNLVYTSAMDKEEMVLYVYGAVAWHAFYVKEGFELPNIETTKIGKVFLQYGSDDKINDKFADRVYVDIDDSDLILYDLVEEELLPVAGKYRYIDCYLELEGYEFLQVGQMYVYNYEGEIYLSIGDNRGVEPDAEEKMQKVKPEYQQAFMDAYTKLNAIREEKMAK